MLERFELECRAGAARAGSFKTSHGEFKTPTFMPVGTRGSVKGVDAERLRESGAQIMLVNTYHLWLRPGTKLVQQLGGIHRFTAWSGPILSDSGGFQVFSLKGIRKLNEQGVEFRSHIDGAKCFLSPEVSVRVQEDLGVDIAMVLDECPAGDLPRTDVERSLELTLRWAKRSLEARQRHDMALFGITQGGTFPDLRKRAAEELSQSPFDAFAIGGLSVGESKDKMY
ncbi:MAG: tRNA-guanine transglycosylase, partial [Bdellovibrionales bacterium]|nr:tRNA-guanine transglycosylase [Bdellovibrionales bacterium]